MENRWTIGFAALLLAAVLLYAFVSGGGPRAPWSEEGVQSARVRATWTLDLETGEQGTPQADLHWGMQAADLPYLAAHGGALLARADKARWEELDAAALAQLAYAPDQFSAWGPDAPVRKGSVFGVRTREGNLAKLRVRDIRGNYALQVEWKLFAGVPAATKAAPEKAEKRAEEKSRPLRPAPPGAPLAWLALRDEALAAYRDQRPEDAYEACRKAVPAARPAGEAHYALALVTCGGLLELHRRYPERIEDWLKEAKGLLARLEHKAIVAALGPREALLQPRGLRLLGVFYRDRNRLGEAAENFALAVDAVRALPAPETAEHRLALRADLYDLGLALAKLGYRGTAERALGEAREYYLKTEPEHPVLKSIDAQLKRLGEAAR